MPGKRQTGSMDMRHSVKNGVRVSGVMARLAPMVHSDRPTPSTVIRWSA
jgi:hypothetical protein